MLLSTTPHAACASSSRHGHAARKTGSQQRSPAASRSWLCSAPASTPTPIAAPTRTPCASSKFDYPSTQAWKRQRLSEAAIPIPPSLTYAPINFERETLTAGLNAAGFSTAQPTFFTWLGVVPYLTPDAVWSTLRFIASLPNGAHVVFDYSDPPDSLSPEMRAVYDERAARVAALGEPWVNHFEAETLHPRLKDAGFRTIEDLGGREIAVRWFPQRAAAMPAKGGHILHAAT